MHSWNWRGIDVTNAHERETNVRLDGIRAAIDAVETGRLPIDRLVTHHHPLEDLDGAFANISERPDGFLKAVVTP
jgi:threonine dehydrogenase-like Zn-dependent dehydrogenase